MIAIYSAPASGFVTLDPLCDLGNDETVAMWKAGVRPGRIAKASGYALLVLGDRPAPVRIDALDAPAARRAAIRHSAAGEVVLLRAEALGRSTVFRRMETIRAMSEGASEGSGATHIVSPHGYLIEKGLSPADPSDARKIAERLAGQLRYAEWTKYGAAFVKYVESLDINWSSLSPSSFSSKMSEIRTGLRSMLGNSADKMMPTWKLKIEATLSKVFGATRQVLRDNFMPTVGISLRQPDVRAIGAITNQQGLFIRNAAGVRSDALSVQARNIVTEGLRDGLGKTQIAQNLRAQLPQSWQAKGLQYFKTIASAGVSRARSYSEVSGYLEVGIESLEVQAILDERTTDICRCLDGMIIETHVASVQVIGAINATDPAVASPFLREVRDPKTGEKSIMSGSGTKIADVVRSGFGRVDDRGQFAYNKSLAGLSEQNIGMPPYHHLCRTWTLPISSTVSVPRGSWPRASGPTSPTPPRPVPAGGKPARGVGTRPQSIFSDPKPGNPTVVGNQDVVNRYPFSDDFTSPSGVKVPAWDGGAFQRYQFHTADMAIRPVGELVRVVRPAGPAGEWNALENLTNSLGLTADMSGVVLHVEQLNLANVRQVVLSEAKQPAATRVYSIRSSDGTQRFIRFNPDKQAAAKDGLSALRKANDEFKISDALSALSDSGYIKIADDANALTFGSPVTVAGPAVKPPTTTRPIPRKKPTPRLPHQPGPPQRRKPPTVTEPRMPYDKPKPVPRKLKPATPPRKPAQPSSGRAKDYSEYGLLEGVPIKEQMQERIALELARLQDYMKTAELRFSTLGARLSARERGNIIRNFVATDTGPVQKITRGMVRDATKALSVGEKQVLRTSVKTKVQSGSMSTLERGKTVGIRPVPQGKAAEFYNDAFQHLSQRVLDKALERGLPRIVYGTNVGDGAFFSEALNAIVLPEVRRGFGKSMEQLFRHEFGHYVDKLGSGFEAAAAFRERYQLSSDLVAGPSGVKYVQGKWGDWYCGRIYEYGGSEVTSVINESFAAGARTKLSEMYTANPDHVAYAMAHAKGAFIP